MFEHILVPVDLSERSLGAMRKAIEIARIDKATITLLHVIETIPGIDFDELEEFYRDLEGKAERVMGEWCRESETETLRFDRLVLCGRRVPEILRVAEERGCDLVIVTSHRVDADRPGGSLGTISHQIGLLAGCSVLLLR